MAVMTWRTNTNLAVYDYSAANYL